MMVLLCRLGAISIVGGAILSAQTKAVLGEPVLTGRDPIAVATTEMRINNK